MRHFSRFALLNVIALFTAAAAWFSAHAAEDVPTIKPARAIQVKAPDSNAATLVYVHGVYHGSWAFRELQTHLDQYGLGHALIDLRGHYGQSRLTPDSPIGYGEYVADLDTLLDAMSGPKVLVGHSLGGLLSLSVARREDVAGLVLLAVPLPEVMQSKSWRLLFKHPWLSMKMVFGRDPSALYHDADWSRQYVIGNAVPDALFRATFERIQQVHEPSRLFADINELSLDFKTLDKPALVIYGTQDPTVDREAASILADGLGVTPVAIEGAGHNLMLVPEHTQRVADHINRWLEQVSLSGPDHR